MNSGGLLDLIESFDTLIHCIIVQNCDTTLIVMPMHCTMLFSVFSVTPLIPVHHIPAHCMPF